MKKRQATAEWRGDLKSGGGWIRFREGRFDEPYSAASRFEDGRGANPEELIAAAHAACYSMALSGALADAGKQPIRVHTEAKVQLENQEDGFAITTIELVTKAEVPEIGDDEFQATAEEAKKNCPVSKALAGCDIRLEARLL